MSRWITREYRKNAGLPARRGFATQSFRRIEQGNELASARPQHGMGSDERLRQRIIAGSGHTWQLAVVLYSD